jgi:hypothetical protein
VRTHQPSSRLTATRSLVLVAVVGLTFAGSGTALAGGQQLWANRYDGPAHDRDLAGDIVASPDGTKTFSTGGSLGVQTGYDFATAAYDAVTGEQLWGERYDGPAHGDDFAEAIAASPGGAAVFVTGSSVGTGGESESATVAYDSTTGQVLWVARSESPFIASSIAVSPGGSTVFVTGIGLGSTGTNDSVTVAYDTATGAQLWVSQYNGPGNQLDMTEAIAVGPGGSTVFVTGRSESPTSGEDYLTIAYDAPTGAQLWAKTYNGPGNESDLALAIGVSPGGSKVFITGWSIGATSAWDYATVAYSASDGHQIWVRRYDGPGHSTDWVAALAVSPGGSKVFVTGGSEGTAATGFDYGTLAYSASTGRVLWVRRYDGPGHLDDFGNALAVGPGAGRVFVTGDSYGVDSSVDWATVANSGAGASLWERRWDGPSSDVDVATAVAASPDGTKVFVAGFTRGPLTGDDFATAAYSA